MSLRSLLIERRLRRELAEAAAEADALLAKIEVSGKPITMSDEQHERLQRAALAAGPRAMARFRELARRAGREGA